MVVVPEPGRLLPVVEVVDVEVVVEEPSSVLATSISTCFDLRISKCTSTVSLLPVR